MRKRNSKSEARNPKARRGPASFARVAEAHAGRPARVAGPYSDASQMLLLFGELECTREELELVQAAALAIIATVREARKTGKYKAYDWCKESEAHQVAHLRDHIFDLARKHNAIPMLKPSEAHAEHVACRIAILLANRIRAQKPGQGEVKA